REGLSVTKTFTDAESARTTDRPQFQEMLSYCRKHKGKITHVVFADLSRLARNVADQSTVLATLSKLGIIPISCDENIEDTAAGKLCTGLIGVVNQFFSDSLSERTKYRMAAGVQAGRWLWVAPIGYLNSPEGLKIDINRADLIRKAFSMAAGGYGLEEVLKRINTLGLTTRTGRKVTKQTLSRILRNQLYCGWVVSGENKVKGEHEALIGQSLFDEAQDALSGKNTSPAIHKKINPEFPLKGFVLCANCGKKLTAGFVKGRRNEKYALYWCFSKECNAKVYVNRDEIERAFVGLLGMMLPTQQFLNQLPQIAKTYWSKRLERIIADRKTISAKLTAARLLNQEVVMQKVSGALSEEDFQTAKENVKQRIADAEAQLSELNAEGATMDALLEETQNNVVDLVKAWKTGDSQRRQELCFSLFPEGLRYSRETAFFESHNTWVINSMREMFDNISADFNIGVPDGI
ncbi:MAG: recombinase family protein, partial [Terriglobales bacterium]